jgi:hypothetical protein
MKRLILAGALTVVALCGYFGVQYYMRAYDPLVAGIPPRENADGTIDYTLIGKDYSKTFTPEQPPDNVEWVVRLPKGAVNSAYGAEDMSMSGGGAGFSHAARPNLGYFIWLRVTDLQPSSSLNYGEGKPADSDGFSLLLSAEKNKVEALDSVSRSIKNYCQVSASAYPQLQAVRQNLKYPDNQCFVGSGNSEDLRFVKWSLASPLSVEAGISCQNNLSFCEFLLVDGERRFNGQIAQSDLPRFADLSDRLRAYLLSATVVDRKFNGKPFVSGENK